MKSKILRLLIPKHFSLRVILLTVFASFATLFITIILSYNHNRNFLNEVFHSTIQQNSALINEKLGEAIIYKDIYTMFRFAETSVSSSNFLKNVYILDNNKEYLTDALSLRKMPSYAVTSNFVTHPVTLAENNRTVGFIVYEIDPQYIVNFALKDSVRIGLSEIIFFVFLVLVVSFFTKLLITPMKVLNSYVEKMDLSNLKEEIDLPWYASKEIRDIAKNLTTISKRLADSIEKNIEQEKKIMANSKMASIGMMSSGLAHELKNPAMTVLLLAQTLSKELDEKYKKDTEYLIRETNKIVKIVNEFLDIAKPITINKSNVKVSDIQKVLKDYIHINFSDKLNMLFINNVKNDIIFTDFDKVIEILINLINNSYEAEATNIEIVFDEQDRYVLVTFRDNGYGIDKSNIDKIFLPFYTTKKSGTGLGLFYIDSIINALNGSINVSSDSSGTTFIVRLAKD